MNYQEKLLKGHATSFTLAVVRDYRVAEIVAEGDGATPRTRFQAASISKMVFALAVLRLASEGRLSLEDDVNRYLGGAPLTRPDGSPGRAAVRQILTHTAGIGVHGFDGYPAGSRLPSTAQIIAGEPPCNSPKICQEKDPGGHWDYSGGGFMVLQRCVENLTEENFVDFMDAYVLAPLEMESSTFRQDLADDIAYGYGEGGAPIPGGHRLMPELAAAGLWTTAGDMAKFGIHIQNILRGERGLIPRELAEEMVAPQLDGEIQMEGTLCRVGLGCYRKAINGREYFGHSGGNEGFESLANFSVQSGDGFCAFANANGAGALELEIQKEVLRQNA